MDHPLCHTFYDKQGKGCLLSTVSSTDDPFRCRSIYSTHSGKGCCGFHKCDDAETPLNTWFCDIMIN